MAHVQKNNRSAAGHLFNYYARNIEEEQHKYLFKQNKYIDPNRTYLNYNLAPEKDKKQNDILKERLSEVKCLARKDVNVMCSWVLTLPKDFPAAKEKEFFKQAYEFLENRYGKKNVISSYVHKDETTPHMHFCFIPVVKDKKTGKEKVSAFELLTRKELIKFHPELERHLEKYFGFEIGVLNEATKEGNKTVAKLKQNTIANKTKEMQQELDILNLRVQKRNNELNSCQIKLKELNQKIGTFEKIAKAYQKINTVGQKSIVGNKVIMTIQQAEELKEQAEAFIILRERTKKLIDENKKLKILNESAIEIEQKLNVAERKNKEFIDIIKSNAELLEMYEKQVKGLNKQKTRFQQMNLGER